MRNLDFKRPTGTGRTGLSRLALCSGMVGISIVLAWKSLAALVNYAQSQPDFIHVLFIPFITLFLIYTERKRIFQSIRPSITFGTALILAGALAYGLSLWMPNLRTAAPVLSGAIFGLVLVWIGVFLMCYGARAARIAVFPLLLLVLMVPIPDAAVRWTIHLLQEGSTDITCFIFNCLGVPAIREGFVISVPGIKIEVAPECSGIRSSLALLITCLLAAHFYLNTWWRKFVFIVLVLPFSMIKNGIRIATLTLLTLYVDPGFLSGSLHRDGGFVFFFLTLAMLSCILVMLQKSETHNKGSSSHPPTTLERGLATD
jgi:exosortase